MRRAAIFDIDGTLLHSNEVDGELYTAALRRVLGPVRLRGGWGAYTHVTDDGILAEVLSDNRIESSRAVVAKVKAVFFEALSAHIASSRPFEEIAGAAGYLARLRRAGVAVAYATGGWRTSARMKLESAGFPVDGVPLATSEDSSVRSELMSVALSRLGDCFDEVTYFGDGEWDRAAAGQLGWHFTPIGHALDGARTYDELSVDP